MKVKFLFAIAVVRFKVLVAMSKGDRDYDIVDTEQFRNCKEAIDEYIMTITEHSPHLLYLLNTTDLDESPERNNRESVLFKIVARKLGFHVVQVPLFYPCWPYGFATTVYISNKLQLKNIINLNVKVDYDHININTANLISLGYTRPYQGYHDLPSKANCCEDMCKSNIKAKTERINDTDYETCKISYTGFWPEYNIKLVSRSIEQYEQLYYVLNYVDFDRRDESKWHDYVNKLRRILLVCIKENEDDLTIDKKDFVKLVKDCESTDNSHTALAAIVPKPLKGDMRTNIPVLFYNTPYLLDEHKDTYKHSLVMYDNYNNILKEALLKLMKKQNWNRIAIVSDDSRYSDDFEAELVNIFREKQVVYAVKPCLKRVCDFISVLKSLKTESAKIIFANVEANYAQKLVETAAKVGLTSHEGVLWIFREWPFQKDSDTRVLGDVFSLFIAPELPKHEVPDFLVNVAKINCLLPVFKEYSDHIMKGRTNPQEVFRMLEGAKTQCPIIAYLRKIPANGTPEIAFSYDVENPEKIYFKSIPFQDVRFCFFRSKDFRQECDDVYLLYIIVVLFLFLVAILAITYIYDIIGRRRLTRHRRYYSTLQ